MLPLIVALVATISFTSAVPFEIEELSMIKEFQNDESNDFTYSGAIPLKDFFNIRDWDTIERNSNLPQAKAEVAKKIRVYYSIDPARAMKELAEVGDLLRIAYAGAKGFKSSTPILKVMSEYQDLIKNSMITSSTFVQIVLKALKYHRYSIMFAESVRIELSLKYLKKCAEMAGRMATESQQLIDHSDKLIGYSVDALLMANDDNNLSIKERARITQLIANTTADLKASESIKKDLAAKIKKEKENEAKNAALANERSGLGIFVQIITVGIVNIDKGAQANARAREEQARKLRISYQNQQRENNAKVAKSVQMLLDTNINKDAIQKAIAGLELTIQTMGKVKTIFLDAKTFWVGVKKHTTALSGSQEQFDDLAMDDIFRDLYIEEIGISGYSWLAIGKICRQAANAILLVNNDIDDAMKNIPDEAEAKILIKTLGDKIMKGLAEDEAEIQKELASAKNQPPKTR